MIALRACIHAGWLEAHPFRLFLDVLFFVSFSFLGFCCFISLQWPVLGVRRALAVPSPTAAPVAVCCFLACIPGRRSRLSSFIFNMAAGAEDAVRAGSSYQR